MGHSRQIPAAFGHCTCHFVRKQRACQTARPTDFRQGDIILHDDHFYLHTKGTGTFGRKTEIQPVAGVILDDQQTAGLSRNGQYPGQHRIHMDRGTLDLEALYAPHQTAVDALMHELGWRAPDFRSRVFEATGHNERDWAARAQDVVAFLGAPRQ